MPDPDEREVYFEFVKIGNAVKVTAIDSDSVTTVEVSVMGPANAAKSDATDLSGVTATGQKYCTCTTSATYVCNASCSGAQKTYVSVQTSYTPLSSSRDMFRRTKTYGSAPARTVSDRTS